MSSKPPAKKRKADEISEECEVDVPHLPAPVWGGILDFMPYAEVRSALLVGKHIAVEAVKYVKAMNVTKSSELNIPAARRFGNVEELNIMCLLEGKGTFNEEGEEDFTVSLETAHCTPSFLSAFPKLTNAFVGGRLFLDYGVDARDAFDEVYLPHRCIGPEDHEEIIRGLVASTAGAFKSGLLSQDLTIDGIDGYTWDYVLGEDFNTSDCYCLTESEFWTVLGERPGGKQAVIDATEEGLCMFIDESLDDIVPHSLAMKAKPIIKKHSPRNLRNTEFRHLSKHYFRELDKVIEAGLDPRRIRKEFFFHRFKDCINESSFDFNIWTKSTVIGLESRGFPVSCDDIITVDDT